VKIDLNGANVTIYKNFFTAISLVLFGALQNLGKSLIIRTILPKKQASQPNQLHGNDIATT
jgi:hypothetical protein